MASVGQMPSEQHDIPTIRELVEDAGFEIELVAGAQGADRECRAVYVGEHLDPLPWMTRASLHLMAGLALRDAGPEEAGPRLLRLLHGAGMAGLGISIPHYLSEVPPAMMAEADRLGLPLLAVTGRTLFRDVERYVFDRLVSAEMQRLRRMVSIQQQLLEQMRGRDPVAEVLQRLASLLDAKVFLFGPSGELVVACVPTPSVEDVRPAAGRLWKVYTAADGGPAPTGFFTAESWAVSCREVHVMGTLHWVLMAARPEGEATDEFVASAVAYVQGLLEVDLALRRNLLRERLDTGAALLEDLIAPSSGRSDLVARLSRHGIGATEPYRVLAMRPSRLAGPASGPSQDAGAEGPPPDEVCARVGTLMSRLGLAFLVCPADDGVAVLTTLRRGREKLEAPALADELVGVGSGGRRMVVGLSEECAGASAAAPAYAHALVALDALDVPGVKAGQVALFDDLPPGRWCLEWLSEERLRTLRARIVWPLLAQPRAATLLETLTCYLRHDASLSDAAQELHVHRNTLCQRIARIERILGLDLKSVEGLAGAHLGVEAARILEATEREAPAASSGGHAPELAVATPD